MIDRACFCLDLLKGCADRLMGTSLTPSASCAGFHGRPRCFYGDHDGAGLGPEHRHHLAFSHRPGDLRLAQLL